MRVFLLLMALLFVHSAMADRYRSNELVPLSDAELAAQALSIEELEAALPTMTEEYGQASTARFLARNYLAQKNYSKAAHYYQQALIGEGLSVYAKQEVYAELIYLYFQQKNYPQVIESAQQYKQLEGKADANLLLLLAVAQLKTVQFNDAQNSANAAQALIKKPTEEQLKQLLYVYYQSQAWAQAAKIQQQIIALHANDLDAWRQLSTIYIQQKDYTQAAAALSLAQQKGLQLSSADILQLAELYALEGNAFAAGRLFEHAFSTNQLIKNVTHLERQQRYWLLAKEYNKAAESLRAMLDIAPSDDRYMQLAQLQVQQQQWQQSKQTLAQACKRPLADEYISKANLLLGMSEYYLGNVSAAEQAFINATLIGGEMERANQWLDFIKSDKSAEKYHFSAPCQPRWAAMKSLPVASVNKSSNSVQKVTYSLETSPAQTLFVGTYLLPVNVLEKRLLPLAMQLGMAVSKERGMISGPLHFIFPQAVKEGDTEIHLQLAFPISKKPERFGRYEVVEDTGFYAANMLFDAPPEKLVDAWKALYETVIADGLMPTGVARQVVLEASKQQVKMRLQLGLKEK